MARPQWIPNLSDSPFDPRPGAVLALAPDLRLVLAPNASPMTERGTNTWILGQGAVTVIDPGPADPAHLRAILAALAPGETVAQILVTHTHNDHSPLSRPLAEASGAPIFGFGDTRAGRSARMQALDAAWLGGGESADEAFQPDEHLSDGSDFEAGGQPIRALHTPGHYGNHLCYQWGEVLFTGDHLMGWAPSLVSPPDGDLTDFMASLDRIETLGARRAYPGHGAPLADAAARAGELRAHRRLREAAILAAIRDGAATLDAITARVYAEVPRALWPAARRNVLAHAIDLDARGLVAMLPEGGTGLRLEPG